VGTSCIGPRTERAWALHSRGTAPRTTAGRGWEWGSLSWWGCPFSNQNLKKMGSSESIPATHEESRLAPSQRMGTSTPEEMARERRRGGDSQTLPLTDGFAPQTVTVRQTWVPDINIRELPLMGALLHDKGHVGPLVSRDSGSGL
jgi:hypothetical protein